MNLPPLIILSSPRSYSSIISTMIGQHPLLYGLPEFTMLRFEKVGEFLKLVEAYRNNTSDLQLNVVGDLRAIAEIIYKDQSNKSIDLVYIFLKKNAHSKTVEIFSMLQKLLEPKRIVFKAPIYSKKYEYMQNFPLNSYFIHLIRHPKDQVKSCLKYGKLLYYQALKNKKISSEFREKQISDIKKKILLYSSNGYEEWLNAQNNIDRFLSTVSISNKCIVRSESLISSPEDELSNICRFLKIDHHSRSLEKMLNPQTSVFAAIGPDNAPYGNDSIFLGNPKIDFDSRVFAANLEGLPLKIKNLAKRYGYN